MATSTTTLTTDPTTTATTPAASRRLVRILVAACGILGTAALVAYYAAPFTFMPLPPATATLAQVMDFGTRYRDAILLDVALQAMGSLLTVIFALALVHLAGAAERFAGRLTQLAGTIIIVLALAEGTFELGAVQAGSNGNPQGALTCFDLTYVFIHIFLLAPALYIMLGTALRGTRLLPGGFAYIALALGIVVQVLGLAGLFSDRFLLPVIAVLLLQEVWAIAAAVALAIRSGGAVRTH
jgi:hypothetical protein